MLGDALSYDEVFWKAPAAFRFLETIMIINAGKGGSYPDS